MREKTEKEQKLHYEMLKDCKTILDKYNIDYILSHSALLGFIRGNDLIKWSLGILLIVNPEEIKKHEKNLIFEFIKAGFKIKRHFKQYEKWKIRIDKNPLNIEIAGYYNADGFFERNTGSRLKKIPEKFFKNLKKIDFKGMTFKCPAETEEYLNYLYGEKWKTPLKSNKPSEYRKGEHTIKI